VGYKTIDGGIELYRGMYYKLLQHLARKQNFTFASAIGTGGGTGIQSANGTWDGTVSDVLYKRAQFSLSTAPTYSSFFVNTQIAGSSSRWLKVA